MTMLLFITYQFTYQNLSILLQVRQFVKLSEVIVKQIYLFTKFY